MIKIKLKRLWQKTKANLINQESNTKFFTVSVIVVRCIFFEIEFL